MALWGKKDTTTDRPKFVALKTVDGKEVLKQDYSGKRLVLIDNDEAALAANKLKGVSGPGWYLVQKVGSRTKVELLISLADAPRVVSGTTHDDSDSAEGDAGVGTDPA